ncbi:MAG: hypothetical protein IPH62_06165 [Ignavibacteriae bacterium]|nr:hypothetical protein [Ignavibacteriota bacterium]
MKKFLFVFVIILFAYCSSPTEYTDKLISVEKLYDKLKITNHNNQTIYLFLVEQEIATLINWAPSFNSPKVEKYKSINIKYSEIYSGDKMLQKGDTIIIYYWDDSNKENPKVSSKVIEL